MIAPSVARYCNFDPTTIVLLMLLATVWPRPVRAQFSSGVDLVEVYASVTDSRGEVVTGLTREAFTVTEGGVPQAISVFAAGDFPLSVAVAIDRSFSMAGTRLSVAKSAARVFLGELRPEDEAAILAIGSRVETVAPLSTNRPAQFAALQELDAFGSTGLYDSVIRAVELTQAAKGRRVLVLLSDGSDRYSTSSAELALERARRADVIIYPVAIGPSALPFFDALAALTGGRAFYLKEPRQLGATLTRIARELRHQYLLGYAPRAATAPETWRPIRVSVARPGVTVRAREGYGPH